jgi:hypothetical protein
MSTHSINGHFAMHGKASNFAIGIIVLYHIFIFICKGGSIEKLYPRVLQFAVDILYPNLISVVLLCIIQTQKPN